MELNGLQSSLSEAEQTHLVQFWGDLSEDQKTLLSKDLSAIDFNQVNVNFRRSQESLSRKCADGAMEPIPPECFGSALRCEEETLKLYEEVGLKAIANGQVGVILLAGGQGTRLGVSYPKGMYDVGLPSKKTLYQLQAERLVRLQQLAKSRYAMSGEDATVPWYIMTSEATCGQTMEFFTSHSYFGLNKSDVVVFEQNSIPCLDFEGKILLEEKHKVARAPDGNGGLYKALDQNGILDDMTRRGLSCVHVYCVDNILVKMADPVFLGFCLQQGADCGAKVVEKKLPNEPVGVVCKVDGKFQVVEYSEIAASTSERRSPDGRLTFNAGNICNHFFTTQFLTQSVKPRENELIHHVAKKKIAHIDESGEKENPSKPNGIKLEKFVFDVFPFSTNFACWEVDRELEFAPIKNADGAPSDSPTSSRNALMKVHRMQIEKNGGILMDEGKGSEGVCEISPLVSYAGEGLESLVSRRSFRLPLHLQIAPDGSGATEECMNGSASR